MSSVESVASTSSNGSFTLSDSCWLTSKPLALPAGVYGCYSHKSFQHTSNFLEKLFRWLVPFFTQVTRSLDGPMRQLHRCSDSVTVPVLAHHNTNLVALLTSNTSGQPFCGILFIVPMIQTSSDMRQISPFYNSTSHFTLLGV